jgi:hypothetical protein
VQGFVYSIAKLNQRLGILDSIAKVREEDIPRHG